MEHEGATDLMNPPKPQHSIVRPFFTVLICVGLIIASHLSPALATAISRAVETTIGLRTTTSQAEATTHSAIKEAEALNSKLETVSIELAAVQSDLAEQTTWNAVATTELSQAYAALNALTAVYKDKQRTHAATIATIEAALADERAGTQMRVAMRTQTIKTLYNARARIKRMAASNVGATVGESIPFVGIGVIVAGTSYEMYESCAAMDEMTELLELLDPSLTDAEDETHAEVCGMDIPTKDEIVQMIKTSPRAAFEGSQRAVGHASDWMSEIEGPDFGRIEEWWRDVF